MLQADALGIPTLSRLLRDIRFDQAHNLSRFTSGRGMLSVFASLAQGGQLRGARAVGRMLTSAHAAHDLERRGMFDGLFRGREDVVAVSCHPRLLDAFAARFGGRIAHNILIPPRHASLAAFGLSEMGPKIFPEALDDTLAQLPDDLAGRIVIVGAGYAGKIVVAEAARRGAVALDLGSVLDYWLGIATRSYQSASLRGGKLDDA